MSNPITIELQMSPTLEKKLDTIIELLSGLKPNCHSCVETATKLMEEAATKLTAESTTAEKPSEPQSEPKTETVKSDHPVDAVAPHAEPVAEDEPVEVETKTITHEDIQSKVKALIAFGSAEQNAAARKAVTSRARNISSLTAEQLWAVWADLEALGEPAKKEG